MIAPRQGRQPQHGLKDPKVLTTVVVIETEPIAVTGCWERILFVVIWGYFIIAVVAIGEELVFAGFDGVSSSLLIRI